MTTPIKSIRRMERVWDSNFQVAMLHGKGGKNKADQYDCSISYFFDTVEEPVNTGDLIVVTILPFS